MMRLQSVIAAALLTALVVASGAGAQTDDVDSDRPEVHFTPATGWINDPNGLVFVDGVYHLFYQHNPDDVVWGPMHWGHATSADLLTWEEHPIALYPDEIGTIFSGSAVIDHDNTAGFGPGAVVAAFTHFATPRQMQSLAYSTDAGATWTKYAENPVLQPPSGIRNFRDPKVIRWEEGDDRHWVMAIGSGITIIFYRSDNLIDWEPVSTVGPLVGAHCGVWETPELFELPIDGGPDTAWVLAVATQDCAPAGGTGFQYFIGDFDGERFTNSNHPDVEIWGDYGADFYAAQAWSGVEDRVVWTGWMNSWQYAQFTPATTWRGSMSLPREVSLVSTDDGPRLAQWPLRELDDARSRTGTENGTVDDSSSLAHMIESDGALDVEASFEWEPGGIRKVILRLHGAEGEWTDIGFTGPESRTYVDRSSSGEVDFHELFPVAHLGPTEAPGRSTLDVRAVLDRQSVEVFLDGGEIVFTELVFPERWTGVELIVEGGEAEAELAVFAIEPGIESGSSSIVLWIIGSAVAVSVVGWLAWRPRRRRESLS